MKTRGAIQLLIACAFALAMIAPAAKADEQDQATQLTFDQPIQIPGNVVLPPGTYWFRLADSIANRNIVQVFDSNWSIVATTAWPLQGAIWPTVGFKPSPASSVLWTKLH